MSGTPPPVVRCLIACEDIVPDELDPRRLSLLRVVNAIRATRYPVLLPQFAVFALLTNGRGTGELWMEIRRADTDAVIYQTPRQQVVFPADPLHLTGASYSVRNLVFPDAGLYWVQLWFDGAVLADLPVVLR